MEVVRIENATRVYTVGKVETKALSGINLTIASGEFTALVGPSGSGKTTLLQLIGCLDQPSSGSVWVDGRDVTRLNRNQRADMRRGHIGFIFQFFALIPTLTAYENVEMPLLLNGCTPKERRARVLELLKAVGLADRAKNRPDQLSGGEQQRVSVARAFVNHPPLLLADEPTGNIDPETAVGIMQLLVRINRTGTTIVVATHDRDMVNRMRRRVLQLDGGRLVRDEHRGGYDQVADGEELGA